MMQEMERRLKLRAAQKLEVTKHGIKHLGGNLHTENDYPNKNGESNSQKESVDVEAIEAELNLY